MIGDATFNSLATGAILVVAIAVLGSITVLPALLAKLGRWVDRPRVPLLWRLNRRIGQGGISRRVLAPVVRRPGRRAARLGRGRGGARDPGARHEAALRPTCETLPQDIPEVQTFTRITESFPVEGTDGGGRRACRRRRTGSRSRPPWTELDESARGDR